MRTGADADFDSPIVLCISVCYSARMAHSEHAPDTNSSDNTVETAAQAEGDAGATKGASIVTCLVSLHVVCRCLTPMSLFSPCFLGYFFFLTVFSCG